MDYIVLTNDGLRYLDRGYQTVVAERGGCVGEVGIGRRAIQRINIRSETEATIQAVSLPR